MLDFLKNLDRRWIFLLMGLSVGLTVLSGLRFPEQPSKMTEDVFDAIENLEDGSRVLIAVDYDPGGMAELHPMSAAFTRHCAKKKHNIYFLTLWETGQPQIELCVNILKREFPGYVYGEDYVNLGLRSGREGVIKNIATNLRSSYTSDVYGQSLDNIPLTKNIKNIQQMNLIATVSAGTPGTKEWVQFASTPYGIDTVCGCTGVQMPIFLPYVPRQLIGVLGAIKAAAEYEQLLIDEYPKLSENAATQEGMRRMGPQLVAHVLIVLLIVVGNVIHFATREGR